ncbi:MAG TPA: hypothetical protein VER12_06790 [Polyangiaceae bacterium]|nr:hypothetical protein [Polyangiaceae bacterium]
MTSSLKHAPSWGGAWYTSIARSAVQKSAPDGRVRNVCSAACIPMYAAESHFSEIFLQIRIVTA